MKLQQTNSGSLFCVIPRQFVKLMNLEKGTEISIYPDKDGCLKIQKV